MIPVSRLVFTAAFFLAEEKERGSMAYTRFDRLKKLTAEGLHLGWQLGVLALLCAGARRVEPMVPAGLHFEKGFCLAGAYLLSKIHGKTPVYFTVLAAMAFGMSEGLFPGWQAALLFLGQIVGGSLGLQVLYLGMKERLLLARVPTAVEGLPLALLSFFLILFAVWVFGV